MIGKNKETVVRGQIFHFKDDASLDNIHTVKCFDPEAIHYQYFEDGLLIIENGKVKRVGAYDDLIDQISDNTSITHYKDCLITPGFIDTHIHSNQSLAVAAYGLKLMEWLDNYIFPSESDFSNAATAQKQLKFFIDLMLTNGTTTACVYAPAQYQASECFFDFIHTINMRVIAGKTMMDQNGVPDLLSSAKENHDDTQRLIEKWHGKGRIAYGVTPRFAIATSNELLEACQSLMKAYPDVYLQTHIHENDKEIQAVKELFPWSKHYLDVYDRYDLVTNRSIFAHCIHCSEEEMQRIGETGAVVSWCPVSNNFLGSGMFDFFKFKTYTNNITLGTDFAGGNKPSMLNVLDDAYKITLLQGYKLASMIRWYLATLGAAKSLGLEKQIGNFSTEKEADFIVMDPKAIPELANRISTVEDIFELLFVLMTLGDARVIKATYLAGELYSSEFVDQLGLKVI